MAIRTNCPCTRLLARWWVNDRPLVPQQTPWANRVVYFGHGPKGITHEASFPFSLDLRALRAEKGDKIGLQLLYCEDGWEWVACEGRWDWDTGERINRLLDWGSSVLPMLSNRVDFIAR